MGNPPYSSGQSSANDLNANQKYPTLDKRIEETYAAKSTATNKNSLYDSYLRAFRWATDRVGDQGIVAFVSNGGWIDGNTGDGVRLSLQDDFSDVYVFNLRGNQRTAGEQSKKEGGKVFGSGSRATIAITIGVKREGSKDCTIHYRDIGDYLTTEQKLDIVDQSLLQGQDWRIIEPNKYGDWVSQRSEEFEAWPALGDKKNSRASTVFSTYTAGLKTGRDSWCYSFTHTNVANKMHILIETYNAARLDFLNEVAQEQTTSPKEKDVDSFLRINTKYTDQSRISWNRTLKTNAARDLEIPHSNKKIVRSLYRPFTAQFAYFDQPVNDMVYQLPLIFPSSKHPNMGFVCVAPGESAGLYALATPLLPDLHTIATSQYFPRFTWEALTASEGEQGFLMPIDESEGEDSIYGQVGEVVDGYRRVDNVTDEIKDLFRSAVGDDVTGDDIFHYVYGKLHDPEYRESYAADLKKMLPHINPEVTAEEFVRVADIGKQLMDLHVGYEDVEPWPLDIQGKGDESDRETWRVKKLKWAKKKDPETGKNVNDVTRMIYNPKVTIAGIPEQADEYMLGSRSALAWIIDRYQVKKDKTSGIVNDPNDWADEVGNPRYIVDLVGKVTRVAVETVRLVEELQSISKDG